ncbi:MAG: hypothetical protein DMG70_09435 [Acidobacteria bacterium]|nr:MAG: hypothetical protein DMG70_09435 [Acidobacteriota bacterium]
MPLVLNRQRDYSSDMWSHRAVLIVAISLLFWALSCPAQQGSTKGEFTPLDSDCIQKQFGSEFTRVTGYPTLTGDFDNDGVEDLAVVARGKNPLIDADEHHFRVLDPYDEFFGVGDPKITSQFGAIDPEHKGLVLLIIHGAGADAWRAETPKAKFVIINLPFKQVAVKHVQIKKKLVTAIYSEETGAAESTSVIVFDGKKYKYQPMGSNLN